MSVWATGRGARVRESDRARRSCRSTAGRWRQAMALRVILGSSSPIRARLLSEMTGEFVVRSPDIDEAAVQVDGVADRERSDPTQLTLAIARAKSDAIRKRLDVGSTETMSVPTVE